MPPSERAILMVGELAKDRGPDEIRRGLDDIDRRQAS